MRKIILFICSSFDPYHFIIPDEKYEKDVLGSITIERFYKQISPRFFREEYSGSQINYNLSYGNFFLHKNHWKFSLT